MATAGVDLWYVDLRVDAASLLRCETLLDTHERARAARMVFAHHRRRYVVCHAAARLVVARAAGRATQALRWAAGPLGRPRVADAALAVSLSRSHDIALVATFCGTPDARVGADVEANLGPPPDPAWLADHVSTEALARAVQAAQAPAGTAASRGWFFDGWTRVEALAKARGTGIASALPTRWDPWRPERPLELPDDEGCLRRWFVHPLPARGWPAHGTVSYHAALAADRPLGEVTIHDLGPAALGRWLAESTAAGADAA